MRIVCVGGGRTAASEDWRKGAGPETSTGQAREASSERAESMTAAPCASAALGKKFGSGATVSKTPTGGQEIDIQGDMSGELPDVLVALFGVPEAAIVVRD